jgi:predicted ATPase
MVGVGASQLLPVVTAVLGVDSGSILLLEQPELHLHPAVQSRLGDFLATARPDVSLLVETHSECLVNRLRLRVVQRKVEPTAIAIYFAEQRNGVARFRSLELNAFGDLNEWPQGFFDEGESDSGLIVRELARRSGVK